MTMGQLALAGSHQRCNYPIDRSTCCRSVERPEAYVDSTIRVNEALKGSFRNTEIRWNHDSEVKLERYLS